MVLSLFKHKSKNMNLRTTFIILYNLIFIKYVKASSSFSCTDICQSDYHSCSVLLTCSNIYSFDQFLHMIEVKRNEQSRVVSLNITNSTIDSLGVFPIFSQQPDNVMLILTNNSIKTIAPSAFAKLRNLKIIYLNNNEIRVVPSHIFTFPKTHQSSIQHIDFSFNFISVIDKNAFQGLISLTRLSLQHNNLTNLQNGVFDDLIKLEYLDLCSNRLVELPSNIFQSLSSLKELYLGNNLIKALDKSTFRGLTLLTNLTLQQNKLTKLELGTFQDLTDLKNLNLSYNKIEILEHGTFSGLENLEILDISGNGLVDLYQFSLKQLYYLTELRFADNNISFFDYKSLKSHLKLLQYLALDNNPWECKELIKISENFQIRRGSNFDVENFRGVACTDQNNNSKLFNDPVLAREAFTNNFQQILEKEIANSKITGFLNNFEKLLTLNLIVLCCLFLLIMFITYIILTKIIRNYRTVSPVLEM